MSNKIFVVGNADKRIIVLGMLRYLASKGKVLVRSNDSVYSRLLTVTYCTLNDNIEQFIEVSTINRVSNSFDYIVNVYDIDNINEIDKVDINKNDLAQPAKDDKIVRIMFYDSVFCENLGRSYTSDDIILSISPVQFIPIYQFMYQSREVGDLNSDKNSKLDSANQIEITDSNIKQEAIKQVKNNKQKNVKQNNAKVEIGKVKVTYNIVLNTELVKFLYNSIATGRIVPVNDKKFLQVISVVLNKVTGDNINTINQILLSKKVI